MREDPGRDSRTGAAEEAGDRGSSIPALEASAGPADELEEAEVEIHLAQPLSFPGVGIFLPEIRVEGDVAYTRITFWVDRDGDGLPGEDEVIDRTESRATGRLVLRDTELSYRARTMIEVYVEDSAGRSRRHVQLLN